MSIIIRAFVLSSFYLAMAVNTAMAQMSTIEQANSLEKFKGITKTIEEMQNEIPMHYLSPEALAEVNDYDPEKIATWVKKNIQFTPSPGYQLSPTSALRTATGNSLEQAILLQNVLVQAGLEVRLAKATLNTAQAMTLLRESFIPSPAKQWSLDPAVRDQSFRKLSLQLGNAENDLVEHYVSYKNLIPWPDSPVIKEAKSLASDFSSEIAKKHGSAAHSEASNIEPWLSNSKDYYFVKYRFSQGDPWLQAHPAYSTSTPVIVNSAYHTSGVQEQHHQITLQAFITREVNGKKETIPVSALHKSTVSELFEKQLKFTTTPSGIQNAIAQRSFLPLQSDQFFAPIINGQLTKGSRFFSLDGKDYSLLEVTNPMGKIAVASNKKIDQLNKRLDRGLGDKESSIDKNESVPKSRLLHYYLTITWSAPGGNRRSLRRTIYRERTGQEPNEIFEAITQSTALAVTPATLTPAAELFESLDTLRSAFELLSKLNAEQYTESQTLNQLSEWSRSRNDLSFNGVVKLAEEIVDSSSQLFSDAPVVALKWELQANGKNNLALQSIPKTKTSFDYLINAAQVAVLTDDSVATSPTRTLEYGVWSTYGEAIVLSDTKQRERLNEQSLSAANFFNKSFSERKLSIISSKDLNKASTPDGLIPAHLSENIVENPEYLFLFPQSENKLKVGAYYRVHPLTGEALGYSLEGRGTAMTEEAAFSSTMIHAVSGAGKMIACINGGDADGEQLSCLGCATLQLAIALISGIGGIPTSFTVGFETAAGIADVGCSF